MSNPLQPDYYKADGIEAKKVIKAFRLNYNLGNVVKYVLRHARKGTPLLDLQKAMEYLREAIADQQMIDAAPEEVKAASERMAFCAFYGTLKELANINVDSARRVTGAVISDAEPSGPAADGKYYWITNSVYEIKRIPFNIYGCIFRLLKDGDYQKETEDTFERRAYESSQQAMNDLNNACAEWLNLRRAA